MYLYEYTLIEYKKHMHIFLQKLHTHVDMFTYANALTQAPKF